MTLNSQYSPVLQRVLLILNCCSSHELVDAVVWGLACDDTGQVGPQFRVHLEDVGLRLIDLEIGLSIKVRRLNVANPLRGGFKVKRRDSGWPD